MERGQHQVSGKGSFDSDLSGFEVSDFADQNDVRILPQERPEGSREVQSDLFLHLHLVDALQLEFDRIFRGHDVGVGLVQR